MKRVYDDDGILEDDGTTGALCGNKRGVADAGCIAVALTKVDPLPPGLLTTRQVTSRAPERVPELVVTAGDEGGDLAIVRAQEQLRGVSVQSEVWIVHSTLHAGCQSGGDRCLAFDELRRHSFIVWILHKSR